MFESLAVALAAAVATALLSTGSAAALAAARRSSETRDAVLVLTDRVKTFEAALHSHSIDTRALIARVDAHEVKLCTLDSRVTALEGGIIDRRAPRT